MPRKTSDITTSRSDAEVAEAIGAHLATEGFTRTGSRKKNVWKKGFYWRIFASCRVEGGVAHLEVWNHLPYPGMGSCLMYFRNRGKLPDIMEAMEKVVGGEIVTAVPEKSVELKYAGFWRRFAAALIDALLFYVVFGLLTVVAVAAARGEASSGSDSGHAIASLVPLAGVVLAWIYFAVLESSKSQATLGKKALGIRVTDGSGERISFGRATGRFWSKAVSIITIGIGFLVAAFTGKNQALHDLMAGTLVICRR